MRPRAADGCRRIAWCLEVMAWVACDEHPAERAATQPHRVAFARGQAMSVDDAVAYGSDERRQPPPSPPDEAPTPLARREQQVAELVARGESNKGIAAALVISRRTAERHIEKIMVKLGFNNRAQVAAWMVAQWSTTRFR